MACAQVVYSALWAHNMQELLPLIDADGDGEVSAQDFLNTFDLNTGGDISVMELLNGMKRVQKRSKQMAEQARVSPFLDPRGLPCGTHEIAALLVVMKRGGGHLLRKRACATTRPKTLCAHKTVFMLVVTKRGGGLLLRKGLSNHTS